MIRLGNEGREALGYIVGEALPYEFGVVSEKPIKLGEYGVVEYESSAGRTIKALCMVEKTLSASKVLTPGSMPSTAEKVSELVETHGKRVLGLRYFAKLQVLTEVNSMLEDGKPRIPPEPPPPSTPVWRADIDDLRVVYAPSQSSWVRIGSLLRHGEVEVRVDVNKVVSRHLAVLSMTGYGKSNLVAILSERIRGLRGTVVIFDVHGEYVNMRGTRVISPRINPLELTGRELADLLGFHTEASKQRQFLDESLEEAKEEFDPQTMDSRGLFELVVEKLKSKEGSAKGYDKKACASAIEWLKYARRWYENLFDTSARSPAELVEEGLVNVVDLSSLTETQLDGVVSHYLSSFFEERRRAFLASRGLNIRTRLRIPLVVVMEEAHTLLPARRNTKSKYWAGRIAREGRKFGLGLVVVSQRPRRLDSDVLSQMGSMALMRIIQREDQASVSSAAEGLSEDLVEQLKGLNPGEAVLIGAWVRIPAVVKVDLHTGKVVGGDVDAATEWLSSKRPLEQAESDLLDI